MAQAVRHRSRTSQGPAQHEAGLREYVEILFRRKLLFFAPAVVIFLATLAVAAYLPKIYQSNTLVFIRLPAVENPVGPANTVKMLEDQLRTIREEIQSFRFLSDIVRSIPEIFLTLNTEDEIEGYVDRMRTNLAVKTRGIDLFEIAYRDPDPQMTMKVANRVTEKYIEDSLQRNTSKYDQGIQALTSERDRFLEELQRIESQITNFKELHKEVLVPEVSVKQQIWNQEASLRALDNQIAAASREMNVLQGKLLETPGTIESKRMIERDPKYEIIEKELRTQELQLEELLLQYTDKHPQVVNLRERIELRRKQLEELEDQFRENIEESINPLYQNLQEQVTQQEIKMENLYGQRESALAHLQELKIKETRVPQLEEQLRNLDRDYAIKQSAYDRVVKEIQATEVQGRMEERGQQVKYEVIDTARVPRSPVEPNVGLLALGGLGAGLAVGFGLVFGREYFDHSLRSVEQARSVLNLTVLGAIPIIVSEEELRRGMQSRRKWMIVWISVVVVLLIGLGAVGFLYRNEILLRLGLF